MQKLCIKSLNTCIRTDVSDPGVVGLAAVGERTGGAVPQAGTDVNRQDERHGELVAAHVQHTASGTSHRRHHINSSSSSDTLTEKHLYGICDRLRHYNDVFSNFEIIWLIPFNKS